METREKIVIIGGGFAGLQLAKKLNNKNKKIIIIDKVNPVSYTHLDVYKRQQLPNRK